MSVTNKGSVPRGDMSAAHELRRVPLGAITGTLCGGVTGACMTGYTQLLQGISGLHEIDLTGIILEVPSVILTAVIGGIGGAIIGTVVGLITGLILAGRNSSGKDARLR